MDKKQQLLMRQIPAMDKILSISDISMYNDVLGYETVKSVVSRYLDVVRSDICTGRCADISLDEIVCSIGKKLLQMKSPTLRPLVNATGIVVHTNLGRSVLPECAVRNICDIASSYSSLEYSLSEGVRGQRNNHVEWLLCQLTGAEAALVVNNNAGAVILLLSALARNKETIVSRGELVEIGGSFRIPDIMSLSGSTLVEVGTTNRTHLEDYENAVTDETAILMKIHPSNYRISGFSSSVDRKELADFAHKNGLLCIEDLGSGMLTDLTFVGLTGDPTVRECIEAGVDLVTFSGDKLLGGPQMGIIVGKSSLINKLKTYPLLRALRSDKMSLAGLESILRLYLTGKESEIPTIAMITADTTILKKRADSLRRKIRNLFKNHNVSDMLETCTVKTKDAVGGGAFPECELPGYGVAIKSLLPGDLQNVDKISNLLRQSSPSIICAIRDNKLILHMRTLRKNDEDIVIMSLLNFLTRYVMLG